MTLNDRQFLVAEEDEALQIAALIEELGQDTALGVLGWWASRDGRTFLTGADALAALTSWQTQQKIAAPDAAAIPS